MKFVIRNSSLIKILWISIRFLLTWKKKLPPTFWNKSNIFGNSVSCDRLDFSFATKNNLDNKSTYYFYFFLIQAKWTRKLLSCMP